MSQRMWREAEIADAADVMAMYAAENRQEPRIHIADQASIEHTLERVRSMSHAASTVVLDVNKRLIGIAFVMLYPNDNVITAQCFGHVQIDSRRQGLGTQLFEWMKKQANNKYRLFATNSPLFLRTSCRDFMSDRIALFEAQGFVPMRYTIEMRCDLIDSALHQELPERVRVLPWSLELDDDVRRLFNLAFQEHWGVGEFEPAAWRKRFVDTPHFRPDLTYLVYVDGRLIGFCLAEYQAERNKQTGLNEVWMEAIGVDPEWRGRGIASGLMAFAMRQYRSKGFTHAGLDVDADNTTHAIALYQKLGFVELRREIIYGKEVE